MITCGIKLTHDAAFCIMEDNRLLFSIEIEKLHNNRRYSKFTATLEEMEALLGRYNIRFADIDRMVVDGWGVWEGNTVTEDKPSLSMKLATGQLNLEVAPYGFLLKGDQVLERRHFHSNGFPFSYSSYPHVSGHLVGAYASSPFAVAQENAFLLVWDGATAPQLFHWDVIRGKMEALGVLMPVTGNIYPGFASCYEPFTREGFDGNEEKGIAGKVMAYIATGRVAADLLQRFEEHYRHLRQQLQVMTPASVDAFTWKLSDGWRNLAAAGGYEAPDVLATFHAALQKLLISSLEACLHKHPVKGPVNLAYSGGCALNIKWNNAIRNSRLVDHIWVPPFPNDSGNAIGMACCEVTNALGIKPLRWNVYSGPEIVASTIHPDWQERENFTTAQLARLLAVTGAPVVFLHGAAELGPRALGARSILASPASPFMKGILNEVKFREHYRPVAPVCMEEEAPAVFDPGMPDPYMLFEHQVRKSWIERIPAVCHLDNTARVQTVSRTGHPVLYSLLSAFRDITGIPLLCNTSANLNGSGFFPDVRSVMDWGRTDYIWCNGSLYYRKHLSAEQHWEEILPGC
ncbi:carbamoyltransferase N-terminal domain-containing protein [Chitinophaga solisilvae]|uniref:carbamoyltransferase N-terminal domain-containing protein n=1 Tax=Chitinophaga solisilvae TaxID=1233460 RepID=UPI00137161AB|nr:carbamoyltransferase N-terminal domain-containing protein [Chitinophaga solisilvae]